MSDSNIDKIHDFLSDAGEDITLVLASLAHNKRMQAVQLLSVSERDFGELQEVTGLSKTALVHHLNKLVDSGVINNIERGRYELSDDGLVLLSSIIEAYSESDRRRRIIASKRADYIERLHAKQPIVDDSDIRIIELPPMKVASVRVISKSPENDAWAKMREWAEPLGFFDDLEQHPVFGFNNPNPSPGKKEYGYEFWIRVEPDFEADASMNKQGISLKNFEGGLYAVTTCRLLEEMQSDHFKKHNQLPSWKRLMDWLTSSKDYKKDKRLGLERQHDPHASIEDLRLDIHMPIRRIRRTTR